MLIRADARHIPLKSGCVQCCVTSPPYWGLRDYGNPNQIGLEKTPEQYVASILSVMREVWRVLRDDGTLWLNLGDCYSGSWGNYHPTYSSQEFLPPTANISSNALNILNSLVESRPLVFGNPATIGITSKGSDISLNDNRFPYRKFLSLLGLERITIKERNNNFCQVVYPFALPSYCWISTPVHFMKRNATDLEIVLDSFDDAEIVISNHDPNGKPVLFKPIRPSSMKSKNGSFAIEETGEPITEWIRDGEAIGDSIFANSSPKCLPNIYLVNQPVSFGNGFRSLPCDSSNFNIAETTHKQGYFLRKNFGIDVFTSSVRHVYFLNEFGSLTHYSELYKKAIQIANENRPKQEIGIPFLVRQALMRDGWICRSTIIWAKPNPMPESVTDRPTKSHEYIFLLSKSRRYYYDHKAIQEESVSGDLRKPYAPGQVDYRGNGHDRGGGTLRTAGKHSNMPEQASGHRMVENVARARAEGNAHDYPFGIVRNKRSVWSIVTKGYAGAHFATFPREIPEICIKAGSRPGDIILDPFVGSGTTLMVAQDLGRVGIGLDLSYQDLASERIGGSLFKNVVNSAFHSPSGGKG